MIKTHYMYNMKKLFILCSVVAIVTTAAGATPTKTEKSKLVELQDSCINMLIEHAKERHGIIYYYKTTNNVALNDKMIQILSDDLWFHHNCDLSIFDGDIMDLINDEKLKPTIK